MPRPKPQLSRGKRLTVAVLLAIFVSGLLVWFNVLLAEDLYLVPFLLVGYVALDLVLFRPPKASRNEENEANGK